MAMFLVEGRAERETRGQYVLTFDAAYAIFREMKKDFPKVNIYEKVNGEYKRIEKWERKMSRKEWMCSLSTDEMTFLLEYIISPGFKKQLKKDYPTFTNILGAIQAWLMEEYEENEMSGVLR